MLGRTAVFQIRQRRGQKQFFRDKGNCGSTSAEMSMQTPLQARILDQLRQLLSEVLEIGDRINEAEISDRLGVSRTPVRRALQQLQAEGAVEYEQNEPA